MPDWSRDIRARLSPLRLPATREHAIVDELSQHLEERWRELVAGGASEEEATRLALSGFRADDVLARHLAPLRLAHTPEPVTPGAPAGRLFGDLVQDVRYAARTLRKHPVFTLAAVLTLAVGIGSNAAIFSVINAILLRPLPFPESERLVSLYTRYLPATGYDFAYFALSGPELNDIRGRVDAFADVAAYAFESRSLAGDGGDVERVSTMRITGRFFDTLGIKPVQGRLFTDDEAQRGEGCLALVRDDAAVRVGSTIRLDEVPCEVIGLVPHDFAFRDDRVKVWTPLRVDTAPDTRQSHGLLGVARLASGVTPEQAEAQLQSLRQYWSETFPDHYAKGHFAITRALHDDTVGTQRDGLVVLGGAVVCVLLIVCVNLAALLVSNGEARRREFAVRHALGANRRRLVRQLIAEAMLLAVVGGAAGAGLANALLGGLLALYPYRLPVAQPITIDYAVTLYTMALVIATGFVVGVIPALSTTGTRVQDTLRSDSRTSASSKRAVAARSVLVVGQLALSVVLLVGAVLLIRAYQRLQRVDLGISPDRVLTFSVSIPPARQPDAAAARRTLAAIEDRLTIAPGVDAAGAISALPIAAAGPADDFAIDAAPEPPPGAPGRNARYLMTTPRLFAALGVTLERGRLLAESDKPGQPLVAVINQTAARLYWPGEDPIGKAIRYFTGPGTTGEPIRIVGIVGDVRSQGASMPAPPAVYVPYEQAPRSAYEGRSMTFAVRAKGDPAAVASSARAAVAAVDPGLALANVRTLTDIVSAAAGRPRFTTIVMSFFAAVAFCLAALGLYGILAYGVEQRVREIGVRVALGASRAEIVALIVKNGMKLTLAGVILGVGAALMLTRLMRNVLFDVSGADPLTYVAVVALLVTCALLASYLPARKATRVDPLIALRAD
jgi:predicted permease